MKISAKIAALVRNGRKVAAPRVVQPMLATVTREPFTDEDWVYAVKWDGYRIMARIQRGKVRLSTRGAQDYTNKYAAIAESLSAIDRSMVLDGEVVVLDEEGKPDFDALQRYNPATMQLTFFVFDILWIDGHSLVDLPLSQRREILEAVLPASMVFRISDQFTDGIGLFEQMEKVGMEGILAKDSRSTYTPGKRSTSWLKIQTEIRGEYVIGGYTESDSNRPFRSLLFGNYQDGKFMYVGHAGGGYKASEMDKILKMLKRYETSRSPFANEVKTDRKTHWLKPKLVANFKFATFTDSGKVRKPAIFLGFRDDKKAKDVVPEVEAKRKHSAANNETLRLRSATGGEVVSTTLNGRERERESEREGVSTPLRLRSAQALNDRKGRRTEAMRTERGRERPKKDVVEEGSKSNWPAVLKQKISSRSEIVIDDKKLELTNYERELWDGVTKAELIDYYHTVSEYILPHLEDRPLSLHLKPDGPRAPGLYIKDMEGHQPRWAETFRIGRKHKAAGKRDVIDYLVCGDEATLLYAVNLGCIDINPWTARSSNPFRPDFIIIDLDPSDDDFSKAIAAAGAAKKVLVRHKIKSFVKTSGKTGIHIYIPVEGFTFSEARTAATKLCAEIHKLVPDITTTEVSIKKRGNLLYLDPNQNDQADTVAAPYSVRPAARPTVSTPLDWREVNAKLDPCKFDIHTIRERLKKKGDLFADAISGEHNAANSKRIRMLLNG
jgi:bifunctional non-homologous end joining protein LigD